MMEAMAAVSGVEIVIIFVSAYVIGFARKLGATGKLWMADIVNFVSFFAWLFASSLIVTYGDAYVQWQYNAAFFATVIAFSCTIVGAVSSWTFFVRARKKYLEEKEK